MACSKMTKCRAHGSTRNQSHRVPGEVLLHPGVTKCAPETSEERRRGWDGTVTNQSSQSGRQNLMDSKLICRVTVWMITGAPYQSFAEVWFVEKKPAMTMTRGSVFLLARQPSAMVLGSYVPQYFVRFLNYEHLGFQGLHVTNGGEDRSFQQWKVRYQFGHQA